MTEQEIIDICKKYRIRNYTINPDGSIDVDGNVNLTLLDITELPIKFNKVSGSFYCYNSKLTSLEGSPKEIGGDFYCSNNKLTTLKGSPESVRGSFYCYNNQLTSLEGSPKEVGGSFNCGDNNPLESLKGLNITIDKLFCSNKEKLIRKDKLKILNNL